MLPTADITRRAATRARATGHEAAAWIQPDRSSGIASLDRFGTKAIDTTTEEQKITDARLGAVGYAFTRSPDAADLSMAAMT